MGRWSEGETVGVVMARIRVHTELEVYRLAFE